MSYGQRISGSRNVNSSYIQREERLEDKAVRKCIKIGTSLMEKLHIYIEKRSNLNWFEKLIFNVELTAKRVEWIAEPTFDELNKVFGNEFFKFYNKTQHDQLEEFLRHKLNQNTSLTSDYRVGFGDLDNYIREAIIKLQKYDDILPGQKMTARMHQGQKTLLEHMKGKYRSNPT